MILTAIVIVGVTAAFPLAWMVLTSLKTPAETMQSPPVWFPGAPSLEAYGKVSGVVQAGRSFVNSAIIATTTTAGILLTSLLAGFAFAKYQFRGREILFAVVIATMFLPPIVTLIPLYRLVGYLHIDGSLAGVIAPNLANAFGIFLMRQFIKGVPDDLIDAARMDGASELRIVFLIVAPSVTPALAALASRAVRLRSIMLEQLSLAADSLAGPRGPIPDRNQPQPTAQLQPGRAEHEPGDGRAPQWRCFRRSSCSRSCNAFLRREHLLSSGIKG